METTTKTTTKTAHQPTRTVNVTAKVREVEKIWFTRRDAAKYLGVSVDYIHALQQSAKLRFYKMRHTVFIAKEDLDKLILRHRVI